MNIVGLCISLGFVVALVACCMPVWQARVIGRVVVVAFGSLLLSSFVLMIIAVDISDPGPGEPPSPYTVPVWLNVYGLSLSLGLLAGEREWRRCKNKPKPAPRLVLEALAYSAIFTGILWGVLLYAGPGLTSLGLHPWRFLVGVGVISLVPGSLAAMRVCRAHKAHQNGPAPKDNAAA